MRYRSVFIALQPQPDPALHDALADLKRDLDAFGESINAEPSEDHHITLAFMGSDHHQRALTRFHEAAAGLPIRAPFDVRFARFDVFSSRKLSARILYAEPSPPEPLLALTRHFRALADRDDQRPHLTLARARTREASSRLMAALQRAPLPGAARIDAVALMANDGSGHYRTLSTVPLEV